MLRGLLSPVLMATMVGPVGAAQARPAGGWQVQTRQSAMDDSKTVVLMLKADQEIVGWLKKHRPALFLRCKEGNAEAFIATGTPPSVEIGNHDGATVRFRYDKEEAVIVSASKDTAGKSLFLPNPAFHIQSMLEHERLLFEFTPFNASPQTTIFTLRGLAQVVEPLQDACGLEWMKPGQD